MDTIAHDHSDIIATYAIKNDLLHSKFFSFAKDYCDDYIEAYSAQVEVLANSLLHNMNPQLSTGIPMKYKFGVQVLLRLRHALCLDQINHNTFW